MLRNLQSYFRRKGVYIGKYPNLDYDSFDVLQLALDQEWVRQKGSDFTFVQVGANDGVSGGDPIFKWVHKFQWNGLLIEPQPEAFEKLVSNYGNAPHLKFCNMAVSAEKGNLGLFRNPEEDTTASFDLNAVKAQNPNSEVERIIVKTNRLSSILFEFGFEHIDFLQIDTEGYELEVLKTLDFEAHRPAIINFEHGHLSRKALSEIFRLLAAEGYALHFGGKEHQDSIALLL